jgi:hypothetical protein
MTGPVIIKMYPFAEGWPWNFKEPADEVDTQVE